MNKTEDNNKKHNPVTVISSVCKQNVKKTTTTAHNLTIIHPVGACFIPWDDEIERTSQMKCKLIR